LGVGHRLLLLLVLLLLFRLAQQAKPITDPIHATTQLSLPPALRRDCRGCVNQCLFLLS
jgi:hypothetical protein